MERKKTGNARRKQETYADGPWTKWPETDAGTRAEKFISTYCRAPKGYGYGQPLKLAPFQIEWLHKILAPGVTSAVDEMPRGQGKSTFHAGLATWALFDPMEGGAPQVPIIATRVQQAVRSVYSVATAMIEAEDELFNRSLIFTSVSEPKVNCAQTGGTMFPMANNVDGLQGLDPSVAIVDEIGFQSIESWNSVILASGKRPRSLVVGVGTPGLDRDNALWHLRSAWAAGKPTPGFVFREHAAPEGCDHTDERNWYIANPALAAGYQNIDALRTALAITPEAHFRIFHLGQWVDGTDAWLGQDGRRVWEALAAPCKLRLGADTWIGLDVGLKQDSTALVLLQRREEEGPHKGKLHAVCKLWFPTDDETVDLSSIMKFIREADRLYKLKEVAYDPRLFELPAQMLAEEGIPMVETPQSLDRMTPAFGELLAVIKRGELTHDGDPAFATQILNGVPKFNERGFTLMKARSRGKIDAAYALAMAYDRAKHRVKQQSPLVAL
jgi:phage terminase large subunit-like protein